MYFKIIKIEYCKFNYFNCKNNTFAVSDNLSVLLFRNEGECQLSLAAELAPDLKFCRAEIQRTLLLIELCRDFADVSGLYRVLETDLVDSRIEGEVAGDVVLHHYGAALCHDFTLDYSRYYRVAGKMSSGEEFIFLDGVFAVGNTILVNLGLVNKEHRLPVRQKLFNVFLVHCMQVLVVFAGMPETRLFRIFSECYAGIVSAESE